MRVLKRYRPPSRKNKFIWSMHTFSLESYRSDTVRNTNRALIEKTVCYPFSGNIRDLRMKRMGRTLWAIFCLFLACLKVFQTSEKLWFRTRIIWFLWIWTQTCYVCFHVITMRESLTALKKLVLMVNKQAFANLHKSLCEDAKKYWTC
jgi:hypothetical protein